MLPISADAAAIRGTFPQPGDGHQVVAAAAAARCRSIKSQWQKHVGGRPRQ